MLKALVQILASLFFGVMGSKFTLTYFQELQDEGSKPLLLVISLALLILGGVFLFNVIRDFLKAKKKKAQIDPNAVDASIASTLDKNNAMTADWEKTNDTRDKLKMLEIASKAEE